MRQQLIGGAYVARSVIAACNRCLNYYPEENPKDSPVPFTYYQRPGLTPLVQGVNSAVRGIWASSQGQGYCVIGQNVYYISPNWVLTLLGQLQVNTGLPCNFTDNGVTGWLVDGSPYGYQITLANNAFAQVNDPTGIFTGANKVDYIDTFMLWNIPNSPSFGSTLSNELQFDPTYTAAKTNYPDPLVTIVVNRHEIILFGQLKSEIWYDAGNALFPFAELPGAYIEHGCDATYSVASYDIKTYWLGRDKAGNGIVFSQKGYDTKRISNHALEYAMEQIVQNGGTLSDAIGYCHQLGGHVFYVLTFPSADQTWVFDEAISDPMYAWHQRGWTDQNGVVHRERANCFAYLYGQRVVGDWQNGTLYKLDPGQYVDLGPDGVAAPIQCIKTLGGHVTHAMNLQGQVVPSEGMTIQFSALEIDMEVGDGPQNINGQPAQIGLRWSVDKGKTFGNTVLRSNGAGGKYLTAPKWGPIGVGRDVVFELSHSIAGPAALNGCWIDATVNAK